ncbi:MAG TPA: bifunctional DNA primase/polymerase [Acidisarcina sp.]|nr:bifunctional DNA primase/polymerase [Acidisarcina sp.]
MRLMEIALDCIRRGWHVFPCWPKSKKPMTERGFKDATTDEEIVRAWWEKTPDANVAIATGASGLCVVDIDHGLESADSLDGWLAAHGLPYTYAVRTGRRPEFGVQLYYSGEGLKSTGWRLEDGSGDIRCSTGYVMAAGSIHPDSGEAYEVLCNDALSPVPDSVRSLTTRANDPSMVTTVDDDTADDWKTWLLEYMDRNKLEARDYEKRVSNGYWLGVHCPWEAQHGSGAGAESSTVLGILDGKIAFECSHGTCKANKRDTAAFKQLMTLMHGEAEREPGAEPEIVLGSMTHLPMPNALSTDWRELFHTKDEALHAPPVTFLIDGFLQREGVTAIAGPVRERKSLIALNLAHALLTGEKLFDHFAVVKRPERVLYLCPEVSLGPFTDRLKKIGLLDCVGETLFYRTLSSDGSLTLNAPELRPALPGSVVILDTAIRFLEGDENSSKDVRAFADSIFALLRDGAESVVMLHHSPKDSGDSMTLENAMRGSGDMGAFLACCWGTRLQDPTHPYESASFMSNLKQRDFESKDFEATCTPDCRMHVVGDPDTQSVTLQGRKGFRGNKDGKDDAAIAIMKANPMLKNPGLSRLLLDHGIERSPEWVRRHRLGLLPGNQLVAT